MTRATQLPPVTLAIEWDNARDVEAVWVERHLAALEAELARCARLFADPPTVTYLYDGDAVDPGAIERRIAAGAPKLGDFARVEIVSVPGADYFGLKAAGILRAASEIVVLLDCDTAPQPGWLTGLVGELSDPEVVAVAGFTTIQHEDFTSRICALAWVYHLPSEAREPLTKNVAHANNLALRASYFRAHPFRFPAGGKKGLASWLRDVEQNGKRWTRAPGARNLHAPHRSVGFFLYRGWIAGGDQAWVTSEKLGAARDRRLRSAWKHYRTNLARALARIVTKRREVGLPAWQVPPALAVAFAHWTATLAGAVIGIARR